MAWHISIQYFIDSYIDVLLLHCLFIPSLGINNFWLKSPSHVQVTHVFNFTVFKTWLYEVLDKNNHILQCFNHSCYFFFKLSM